MDEKQKASMGELAALMYEDPEMRPTIDKWTEERFPGVHARTAAKKVAADGAAAIDAKIREFDGKVEQEKASRARQTAIDRIVNDPTLRVREDEIPDIEKLMAERYIGHYEDAAKLYRQQQAVAAPRGGPSLTAEVPGLDGAGGDETAWLKPAFANLGDRSLLDRVTKRRVEQIRADFAAGRSGRWSD